MNRYITTAALASLALAGATATPAEAHVTLQPEEAAAGSFERLDVRVPNERDNASTKKVEVQFPPGFIFASYEPVPGWTGTISKAKLDKPVEAFGEEYSEEIDRVTFTTEGRGIRPGQFADFGLSLGLPDDVGRELTFKALQTYSNGEVVRWIGPPDADEPAARVKLTAAEEGAGAGAGSDPTASAVPEQEQAAATDGDDDDSGGALSVIALIVGALGLLAGVAGLSTARRVRTAG